MGIDSKETQQIAISMSEAAALLGISRASLYALADRDPTFPAFHIGGCRRVNVAALRRWTDAQTERGEVSA